jgi:hypothetical protein
MRVCLLSCVGEHHGEGAARRWWDAGADCGGVGAVTRTRGGRRQNMSTVNAYNTILSSSRDFYMNFLFYMVTRFMYTSQIH